MPWTGFTAAGFGSLVNVNQVPGVTPVGSPARTIEPMSSCEPIVAAMSSMRRGLLPPAPEVDVLLPVAPLVLVPLTLLVLLPLVLVLCVVEELLPPLLLPDEDEHAAAHARQ